MSISLNSKETKRIENLVEHYKTFKKLTLHFEERENKAFPPAVLGTRDALDHLMRAFFKMIDRREIGECEDQKDIDHNEDVEEYILENLKAAENHIYRAIFELLDVMVAMDRKRITDIVSPYSNETINVNAPFYYTEIRDFLIAMQTKVEDYRSKKDAFNIHSDDVAQYLKEVKQLENYTYKIETCIPQMESYEKDSKISIANKLERSTKFNWIFGTATVISLILAIIGFFA